MKPILATLFALALGSPLGPAQAAEFPQRPVKVLVPFPAGGAADAAMRVVAKKLTEYWTHQVLVENSAGVQAIKAGAAAPADGHHLLLAAGSQMVTGPLMRTKLPYHPQRDFVPVGRLVTNPPVLVVHPSIGVASVRDLVALAKRKPGDLNFSSSGIGSPNQLAMELFQAMTGTEMVHVPYKGGAPSVVELVGGQVQLGINAIPSVLTHIRSNRLVPLAVASKDRARSLPELPTIAEAGVPGFEYTIWYALFAPAATPPEIVQRISRDLQRALADPEVARQLSDQGNEPAPASSAELARFMAQDSQRWAALVRERKLQVEE
ncbi:Bug family tripartite tricarboxylate transporter substrate binding protein [Piscinibacter defluvii]|uniref:Bug family tripartite tricarboxylate transporter substrate binding protein n=1 Tax=Piscinibacter defluvii TaxID=1796922 RepID=UPI000FDDD4DB|nr:tripartite tricarboxylate transporter substrate binding protein [Piscinibacter defluvii]